MSQEHDQIYALVLIDYSVWMIMKRLDLVCQTLKRRRIVLFKTQAARNL